MMHLKCRKEKRASPFASMALASTSNVAYNGSPNEVFSNLPNGLTIDVGSPADGDPSHSYTVEVVSCRCSERKETLSGDLWRRSLFLLKESGIVGWGSQRH